MRQRCSLSPLLFNIVLNIIATAIKEETEVKGTKIGKEEFKLSLFTNDMILCIQDPEYATTNLLELNNLVKLQAMKLIHRNMFCFCILTMRSER